MADPHSLSEILWSSDPATQRAIWFVLALAAAAAVGIFVPLLVRAVRLLLLERRLRDLFGFADRATGAEGQAVALRSDLRDALLDSPLQETWQEFERRWSTAQVAEGLERAPVRLIDCLDDRPLLPIGPRRSLLPVLPGLFLGAGVLAALVGLIPSLSATAVDGLEPEARSAWLATQLGLALRATAWGFLCAIGAFDHGASPRGCVRGA